MIRFRFRFKTSAETLECLDWSDLTSRRKEEGGCLITSQWVSCPDERIDIDIDPDIKYLIVIEKEGIFHRLCEDEFHR